MARSRLGWILLPVTSLFSKREITLICLVLSSCQFPFSADGRQCKKMVSIKIAFTQLPGDTTRNQFDDVLARSTKTHACTHTTYELRYWCRGDKLLSFWYLCVYNMYVLLRHLSKEQAVKKIALNMNISNITSSSLWGPLFYLAARLYIVSDTWNSMPLPPQSQPVISRARTEEEEE